MWRAEWRAFLLVSKLGLGFCATWVFRPDVFAGGLASFSQELDLATATVTISSTSNTTGVGGTFKVGSEDPDFL